MISTGKLLVGIVRLCFEAKEWDMLNDNIVVITKKRSQLKQVNTFFAFSESTIVRHITLHS